MPQKSRLSLNILILLILALIAFAGNSLLNRAALSGNGTIDWASFTSIRIVSGALFLWALMTFKNRNLVSALPRWSSIAPALALFAYATTFSYAYISLGAGIGALILFATVQFTLQGIGIAKGHIPSPLQVLGLIMAFAGLVLFLLPSGGNITFTTNFAWVGYMAMIIAGIAWGIYSWIGRSAANPALETARNFIGAAPLCLLLLPFIMPSEISSYGIILAIASGVITSGLGYIIWYAVLPKISVSMAATAQLSVPAIAAIGGILFLDEAITKTLLIGSAMIFAGIGLTIWRKG